MMTLFATWKELQQFLNVVAGCPDLGKCRRRSTRQSISPRNDIVAEADFKWEKRVFWRYPDDN